jgi:LPXTG-motif cell wall-anchored protein
VLPPIGSNAGLVIGASVLVLIIIGGVLGARRRQNH